MNWFTNFERRYQNFGIPGLIRIVALLQAVVFVLLFLKPEFQEALTLNFSLVKQGQLWRLITFCLIPQTHSVIWIVIAIMFLLWLGASLESAWGPLRLTLFYFGVVLMLIIGSSFSGIGYMASSLLYMNLFLAFASTFPTAKINLYGIIPVQARWLGWLDLAIIALMCYQSSTSTRLAIALAMVPYFVIALPSIKHTFKKWQLKQGRSEFATVSVPGDDHFHQCTVCKRTDVSNPELVFRVMDDDTERCQEHL
jgi:hypothetical protein